MKINWCNYSNLLRANNNTHTAFYLVSAVKWKMLAICIYAHIQPHTLKHASHRQRYNLFGMVFFDLIWPCMTHTYTQREMITVKQNRPKQNYPMAKSVTKFHKFAHIRRERERDREWVSEILGNVQLISWFKTVYTHSHTHYTCSAHKLNWLNLLSHWPK